MSLSPLHTSLIGTMNSPFTAGVEMLVNIPTNNNPHPLHSIFNDDADHWVSPDGNVLHLVFPAKLHLNGCYNKSGEYFNLPETGIIFSPAVDKLDLTDIKSAKIQFEVLPLSNNEKDCPALAIGCSQFVVLLLCPFHSETEDAHNASLDAGVILPSMPFWHTYDNSDNYNFVITAGAAFKDVPDMKMVMTPQMTHAEAVNSAGLMSPSKVRANAKKYSQALGKNKIKKSD
ncbi:hypothetical protein BDR04DRAFT_1121492, partial [Suillus decipiens]